MRREFKRGPFFAEAAEALGLPTDQVIALVERPAYVVFYGPDGSRVAVLVRDFEGILRLVSDISFEPDEEANPL